MEITVNKIDGTQSGDKLKLNDSVFNIEPNDHVMHRAVQSYLAAQRQGTHLARNRSLVTGSGKKPYRQKGTGRARAGTVKSNIWRGGGKSFGPQPHKYSQGMNKKEKRLARRSALTYKSRESNLIVVEDFDVEKQQTSQVAGILKALNIDDSRRTMIVIKEHSPKLWQSCRNIKNLTLKPACQLNTYEILRQEKLLIQKSAAEIMNEVM